MKWKKSLFQKIFYFNFKINITNNKKKIGGNILKIFFENIFFFGF